MPWFYRCEVQYVDPNDLLEKSFNVTISSANRIPTTFAANAIRQKAYSLIERFKVSPPDPQATQDDYEIELSECVEAEG